MESKCLHMLTTRFPPVEPTWEFPPLSQEPNWNELSFHLCPIFRLATSMYVTCMLLTKKKIKLLFGNFSVNIVDKREGS
jgi:hypothetical protein